MSFNLVTNNNRKSSQCISGVHRLSYSLGLEYKWKRYKYFHKRCRKTQNIKILNSLKTSILLKWNIPHKNRDLFFSTPAMDSSISIVAQMKEKLRPPKRIDCLLLSCCIIVTRIKDFLGSRQWFAAPFGSHISN